MNTKYTIKWKGKEGKQKTEFSREATDELDVIECLIHFFNYEKGRSIYEKNYWDSITVMKQEKESAKK
jgi:hypothetical protein